MSNDVQPGVDTFVRLIVRMEPKARVIGFDLARAYAILGMFIVNFNIVFGNYTNHDGLNRFLNLFNGNSSTLFVMLAGMGVALMSNRPEYSQQERKSIRSLILKRSGFLFVIGLLLFFLVAGRYPSLLWRLPPPGGLHPILAARLVLNQCFSGRGHLACLVFLYSV